MSTIIAIWSKGTANVSWSTKQIRSAGVFFWRRRTFGGIDVGVYIDVGISPLTFATTEFVEVDPRDDRREPTFEIVDRVGVRARQAKPGILHGVVGVVDIGEHPIRDGTKL